VHSLFTLLAHHNDTIDHIFTLVRLIIIGKNYPTVHNNTISFIHSFKNLYSAPSR